MATQPTSHNSYDDVPYPTQSLPQSHPNRLAGVATLFGMHPKPLDGARILELGCATGANLIPMAEQYPEATFLGIDSSLRQITAGRRAIEHLGLKNIDLRQLDILTVDEGLGQFDYIIAHGVFSWVPPNVQEKIFEICRSLLAEQGVAYLSYNIYPGWHLRNIIRELAIGCAARSDPPNQRINQFVKVLRFFSKALAKDESAHSKLLRGEIDLLLKQPIGYLFHDFLEDDNRPLYFHEFAARAAAHDLQYVGEAVFNSMFAANFGPAISQSLLQVSTDVISIEQHMDLLRNRAFRQTLLCHKNVALQRIVSPEFLRGLYLTGEIQPENNPPNLKDGLVEKFSVQRSTRVTGQIGSISTPARFLKAALWHIGNVWPRAVSHEELLDAISARLSAAGDLASFSALDHTNLGHNLIQCLAMGLLDAQIHPNRFASAVSECPRASRLARWQAQSMPTVTNGRHEVILLTEVNQRLLKYLDGEHDRPALLQMLIQAVDRGEISILVNGIPASRGEAVSEVLQQTLDTSLATLAANAVLVA
jgi:methyltransferase-like protein/ubiquinone/menaquinone biosynthesis C-methylase UbiE